MPGAKGAYRSVYSAIWDDPEFQGFSPTAQLIFLHLRTSKECNFPCVFVWYRSTLYERMPMMDQALIDAGIEELLQAGWIRYDRPVLWITKGLKNEPSFVPSNEKQVSGIANIIRTLPKVRLVSDFASMYDIPYGSSGSPPHAPMQAPSMPPSIQASMRAGKQGKGKGSGSGKGKEDLDLPVDNSAQSASATGAKHGPDEPVKASSGPAPLSVAEAQRQLVEKRRELGLYSGGKERQNIDLSNAIADVDKFLPKEDS